jgi:uncharacterized protein (TIGR03000 family)
MRPLTFLAAFGIGLLFITSSASAQMMGPGMQGRMGPQQRGMMFPNAMGNMQNMGPSNMGPSNMGTGRYGSGYGMNPSGYNSSGYGNNQSGYGSYPSPSSARTGSAEPELPHPAGDVRVAPADAGVIRLRLPDRFADVSFGGHAVSSIGTSRTFVTPRLSPGQKERYEISVTWLHGNQRATREEAVELRPGEITTLDLRRQPDSSR